MVAYTRATIKRLLEIDFIRFCIVGGSGFIINFILLIVLPKLFRPLITSNSVRLDAAQFIGAEVALFSNFMLHHNWTYKKNKVKKSILSLLVQFHATSWPAIVGSTIMVHISVNFFHLSKFFALAIASIVALLWNFGWSKYVIWRNVEPADIEEVII